MTGLTIEAAVAALKAHDGRILYAARQLGVPKRTLSDFVARSFAAKAGADTMDVPPDRRAQEIVKLRGEVTRLRAEIEATHRLNLDAEFVRETIMGLAAAPADPPNWLVKAPAKRGFAGLPITIWSDWHIGEKVNPAEVNGVNAFDERIARERVKRLVERTIDIAANHMTGERANGIVVNALGDFVTGEIHEELSWSNDLRVLPSVLLARDLMLWGLRTLADHFGRVFVACASGNHGRNTHKIHSKGFIFKNFDWLIYQLLERAFAEAGDKRVVFMNDPSNEAYYSVYGHRYLAVHGHDLGVKGGDGIIGAIGPIMRGEIRTAGSSAQIGRSFDTLVIGHWHQSLWLPRAIVNNALIGFNEYARAPLRARYSRPSQSLWFQHPKHGITAKWEIFLEDLKTGPAAEPVQWGRAA